MTVDQFMEFCSRPENDDRFFELVRGEVIELPPPRPIHGALCTNFTTELNLYARKRRKGHVTCNDSGVIFERDPDTVRGPDVAYFTTSGV